MKTFTKVAISVLFLSMLITAPLRAQNDANPVSVSISMKKKPCFGADTRTTVTLTNRSSKKLAIDPAQIGYSVTYRWSRFTAAGVGNGASTTIGDSGGKVSDEFRVLNPGERYSVIMQLPLEQRDEYGTNKVEISVAYGQAKKGEFKGIPIWAGFAQSRPFRVILQDRCA